MLEAGEAVTRDGCSVELYRRLPYRGDIKAFAEHVPAGCSLLELGCGAGRMTQPLLDTGYRVTAVDNSPAMLDHVPAAAERILCDIETLRLPRKFDVVLLASCLINTPGEAEASQILETCRRHLAGRGVLVFERHSPKWLMTAEVGALGSAGDIAMFLERVSRRGDLVDACVRYQQGSRIWRHAFTTRSLDDATVDVRLENGGLTPARWLDERRVWGISELANDDDRRA